MKYSDQQEIFGPLREFMEAWKKFEKDKGNCEDFVKKFTKLMAILSPDAIIKIPHEQKKEIKEKLYPIIRDLWKQLGSGKAWSSLDFYIWNVLPDWVKDEHMSFDVFELATVEILTRLPYFDPDKWLDKYFSFNPLILSLSSNLPKEIEKRLGEATYCYIYGFYNASAALCRSVLEGALKEKFKKEVLPGWSFEEMLKWLEKKSSKNFGLVWNLKKIKSKANKMLHNLQEDVDEERCRNIIKDTRTILEEIFEEK